MCSRARHRAVWATAVLIGGATYWGRVLGWVLHRRALL